MKNIKLCINELIKSGFDDWVQAYELVWIIKTTCNIQNYEEVKKIFIIIIEKVVNDGLMIIGEYSNERFQPWDMTLKDSLEKVKNEFSLINRQPNLGEICWLCNTTKGDEIAKELLLQDKQLDKESPKE